MKQHLLNHFRGIVTCIIGLVLMVLVTACAGVGSTGSSGSSCSTCSITGSVQSVDTANSSVTLNVNGQTITIKGLTSAELSTLQSQVGKVYTIHGILNTDGSYTISNGTILTNDSNLTGVTPGIETDATDNGTVEQGSITFIGKVQSVSSSTIVVSMPNGQTLSMSIVNGQTDLGDFNNVPPSQGQTIKVEASTNTDGSFMAKKLSVTDSSDLQAQNTVEFQGVTTSAVGSDNVIHFNVGNKSFSYSIPAGADLGDFNNNAQSIGKGQTVKVTVLFQGSTATVQKVSS